MDSEEIDDALASIQGEYAPTCPTCGGLVPCSGCDANAKPPGVKLTEKRPDRTAEVTLPVGEYSKSTVPKEPYPMNVTYYTRAQVGYNDTLYPRRGYVVLPAAREGWVHHHTVGADTDGTKNRWESEAKILVKARRMQTVRPDLGLDVPYNFLNFISQINGEWSLVICEGRGWNRTGAHTAGHNTRLIASGWVGDFRNEGGIPDDVLEDALRSHGAWVAQQVALRAINIEEVAGHRDYKATSCPSDRIYSRLDTFSDGTHTRRLDNDHQPRSSRRPRRSRPGIALQFAIDEATQKIEIGAHPSSDAHELAFLRALAVAFDVPATDEVALAEAIKNNLGDPAVENAAIVQTVIDALTAGAPA